MKRIVISIGIVVAIALVVCLVPLKEVAYAVMVDYEDTETYYETEPLEYREFDSFSGATEDWIEQRAAMYGYGLPDELVLDPDWALYVVIQNLDNSSGTFQVCYTLATADKEAAERQMWIIQRTPEEYEELDREYWAGNMSLYLEHNEIGLAICPPEGIYVAPDRVPFEHSHEIIVATKEVERQRIVTRQRQEVRYNKVTLLDYLLHYQ